MEGGETPMRYLSGIVILENGMECDLRNYNLADELVCGAIDPYLNRLVAKQEETPAVGAAGESG